MTSATFFIYLTGVQSDNGCMCYIPKSHKIVYALKMGILEKKIEYQKFQFLKDFRKAISELRSSVARAILAIPR